VSDIIQIRTALADIYHTTEPFALTFIKKDGTACHKDSVRLGGGTVEKREQKSREKNLVLHSREAIRIKDGHRLVLFDNHNHHLFYVRICLLTHYNGLRIIHQYGKPRTIKQ
jgi:hypothetical protein